MFIKALFLLTLSSWAVNAENINVGSFSKAFLDIKETKSSPSMQAGPIKASGALLSSIHAALYFPEKDYKELEKLLSYEPEDIAKISCSIENFSKSLVLTFLAAQAGKNSKNLYDIPFKVYEKIRILFNNQPSLPIDPGSKDILLSLSVANIGELLSQMNFDVLYNFVKSHPQTIYEGKQCYSLSVELAPTSKSIMLASNLSSTSEVSNDLPEELKRKLRIMGLVEDTPENHNRRQAFIDKFLREQGEVLHPASVAASTQDLRANLMSSLKEGMVLKKAPPSKEVASDGPSFAPVIPLNENEFTQDGQKYGIILNAIRKAVGLSAEDDIPVRIEKLKAFRAEKENELRPLSAIEMKKIPSDQVQVVNQLRLTDFLITQLQAGKDTHFRVTRRSSQSSEPAQSFGKTLSSNPILPPPPGSFAPHKAPIEKIDSTPAAAPYQRKVQAAEKVIKALEEKKQDLVKPFEEAREATKEGVFPPQALFMLEAGYKAQLEEINAEIAQKKAEIQESQKLIREYETRAVTKEPPSLAMLMAKRRMASRIDEKVATADDENDDWN